MTDIIAPVRALRERVFMDLLAIERVIGLLAQGPDGAVEPAANPRQAGQVGERRSTPALPAPAKPIARAGKRGRKAKSKGEANAVRRPAAAKGGGRRGTLSGEQLEQLRALWPRSELTRAAVAEQLGCSLPTLDKSVKALSLPPRPRGIRARPAAPALEDGQRACAECRKPYRSIDAAQDLCAKCRK